MYKEKVMKITSYIVGSQTLSFSIHVCNVRLALCSPALLFSLNLIGFEKSNCSTYQVS